jgi:methyl coenzyme M reductase gamma subunit
VCYIQEEKAKLSQRLQQQTVAFSMDKKRMQEEISAHKLKDKKNIRKNIDAEFALQNQLTRAKTLEQEKVCLKNQVAMKDDNIDLVQQMCDEKIEVRICML